MKSSRWYGSSLASARRALVLGSGENHFAHGVDPVAFKNMCSVRQSPMPSAPKCDCVRHLLRRVGVCANAERARTRSTQFISLAYSLIGGAFLRVERAIDQHLHNLGGRSRDFAGENFARRFRRSKCNRPALQRRRRSRSACAFGNRSRIPLAPQTQTLPICRATSAACDETPPREVRIPSAAIMPRKSSGEVSMRASTTFVAFLRAPHRFFRAEDNVTGSRARPGGQTAADFLRRSHRFAIKNRREKMSLTSRPGCGRTASFFRDQSFTDHIDRDADGSDGRCVCRCAFAECRGGCLRP